MIYERTITKLAGLLHLDLRFLCLNYFLSLFLLHFRASKLNIIGVYGKWCLE